MRLYFSIVFCLLFSSISGHAQSGFFGGFDGGSKTNAPQPGFGFLFGEPPTVENKRPRVIIRSPRNRSSSTKTTRSTSFGNAAFCVRTCDGFYFPIKVSKLAAGIEQQKKICNTLCPGSQTLLYSPRTGNDIESAVDLKGNSYSKSSNALRFRKEVVSACSCQSQPGDGLANLPITQDATLKKGDMVVTKTAVRTFKGATNLPYDDGNFSKPQDINKLRLQLGSRRLREALSNVAIPTESDGLNGSALPVMS